MTTTTTTADGLRTEAARAAVAKVYRGWDGDVSALPHAPRPDCPSAQLAEADLRDLAYLPEQQRAEAVARLLAARQAQADKAREVDWQQAEWTNAALVSSELRDLITGSLPEHRRSHMSRELYGGDYAAMIAAQHCQVDTDLVADYLAWQHRVAACKVATSNAAETLRQLDPARQARKAAARQARKAAEAAREAARRVREADPAWQAREAAWLADRQAREASLTRSDRIRSRLRRRSTDWLHWQIETLVSEWLYETEAGQQAYGQDPEYFDLDVAAALAKEIGTYPGKAQLVEWLMDNVHLQSLEELLADKAAAS